MPRQMILKRCLKSHLDVLSMYMYAQMINVYRLYNNGKEKVPTGKHSVLSYCGLIHYTNGALFIPLLTRLYRSHVRVLWRVGGVLGHCSGIGVPLSYPVSNQDKKALKYLPSTLVPGLGQTVFNDDSCATFPWLGQIQSQQGCQK